MERGGEKVGGGLFLKATLDWMGCVWKRISAGKGFESSWRMRRYLYLCAGPTLAKDLFLYLVSLLLLLVDAEAKERRENKESQVESKGN